MFSCGGKGSGLAARSQTPEKCENGAIAQKKSREGVLGTWIRGVEEEHDYGKRWAVEGFFSAVKRCFGETVRATTPEGMFREVKRKFALYNWVASL